MTVTVHALVFVLTFKHVYLYMNANCLICTYAWYENSAI